MSGQVGWAVSDAGRRFQVGCRTHWLVGWAGMALPVAACAGIWAIGGPGAPGAELLVGFHKLLVAAVTLWTGLRLVLRWQTMHASRMRMRAMREPGRVVLYALLALQPSLAVAADMMRSGEVRVFGVLVPSVLPLNAAAAHVLALLHGWNAVLLLVVIGVHILMSARALQTA
jgi:cytochrome b561